MTQKLSYVPDDHSRVILKNHNSRSKGDYINANYVDVSIQLVNLKAKWSNLIYKCMVLKPFCLLTNTLWIGFLDDNFYCNVI